MLAVFIEDDTIGAYQFDGYSLAKCVCQNLIFFYDKDIGCVWRASHMVIKHFLKRHQIIGQNLIGSIERDSLGHIFSLGT